MQVLYTFAMRKSSLYSLVFTIFNDSIGWAVVLTIFAPLLMNPTSHFLPEGSSLHMQNMLLGILLACYPFTQFIFMPLLGALSDAIGRKTVLKWTILCAGLSFVLSAFAIWQKSLILLLLSRIFAGIFSANASTAQASIADISSEQDKAKNLSLSSIAGGVAWIAGPIFGGVLSSDKYISWADFATPFWFVAILFFLNYLWIQKAFQETFLKPTREKHDWKQEIKDIAKLSHIPRMTAWLCISFFFYFGWGFLMLFYPALLVQRFHLDQSGIGLFSGYLSLFWLLSSIALNRGLAERFKPESFILFFMPIVGILSIAMSYVTSLSWWFAVLPFLAIGGSAIWINLLALLSNLAGKENQGKVFGVGQSLMSLALFISPLLSGGLAALHESLPLAISGIILTLTGSFASLYYFKR